MLEIAVKIPKFIIANGLGTAVDTAVLWVFSHYVFNSYAGDYIISPIISFECAVSANFCTSFFYIWRDRINKSGFREFLGKYLIYNLSASVTFIIKMGFLLLFEAIFGWNVVICNLAALCISGTLNFVIDEWIIFRRKK